jgi:hypothetical protein
MRAVLLAPLAVTAAAGTAIAAAPRAPEGAPATCGHQSSASFPRSGRDLVVGPLVLVGARADTSAETVARFGGQKYPALVLAGHRVTIELAREAEPSMSLYYADDHHTAAGGERTVAAGHRVVAFRSCSKARAGSAYAGRDATFWSGFVLTTKPRCVALRVWVDGARTPRRARIPLGRPCD